MKNILYKRVDVFHHKDVDSPSGVTIAIGVVFMITTWVGAWASTGSFWGIFIWLGKALVWIIYSFFYGVFTAFF